MFHFRVKIIGRSAGRTAAGASAYRSGAGAAASMAYRAGEKLRDPATGKVHDYSRKARIDAEGFGILHSEIMLPREAPAAYADRQTLIDAIEAAETRRDAQLMREVEISLPRELTFEQQRDLIRDFVRETLVSRGMIADIAIHDEQASDGGRNPHAHVLLTMRRVTPEGFQEKVRAWNSRDLVHEWRQAWADMANERLAQFGHERRLDPRSYRDRGIDLNPDSYVGPSISRPIDGVLHADRQDYRHAAKQENIDLLTQDPAKLVDLVSREKATFTERDLAAALRRATALERDDPEFDELMAAALGSPELVAIASDRPGAPRYATRSMIACEAEMARAAHALARRSTCQVEAKPSAGLSIEQQQAFLHAVDGPDLICISGVAGAGKTTTLAAIAEAFKSAGHRVRGAALAGVAARNLREEADIPSATLHATFHGWDRKGANGLPDPIASLERGDVFILDEAGLVGSRQMRRLLGEAAQVGAKVILVGDSQQLQAIEAGAAFRTLVDSHGSAALQDVRRQTEGWQKDASALLADRRGDEALDLYRRAGRVHAAATTDAAMDRLVGDYLAGRDKPGSQVILSHYVSDTRALNARVREALRERGEIGQDVRVSVKEQVRDELGNVAERAQRATFAQGDDILFTRNDRVLDVQNGTRGKITTLDPSGTMKVRVADGRDLTFSVRDYPHLALGYAMTVHKAQGATYDRAYVLASSRMNAHISYVAMTRHRHDAAVYFGRDQFEHDRDLTRAFCRQELKDSTHDYLDAHLARLAQERGTDRERKESGRAMKSQSIEQRAPLSAAERIRQNVSRRRAVLQRDANRSREFGD